MFAVLVTENFCQKPLIPKPLEELLVILVQLHSPNSLEQRTLASAL